MMQEELPSYVPVVYIVSWRLIVGRYWERLFIFIILVLFYFCMHLFCIGDVVLNV